MSYSHRIWIYWPVGLLLMVVLLYSIFWRVEADMLAARLDRANGGEIAPGVMFAFAEKSIGGYPFRLDVLLSGVTVAHRSPDGEIAWRSERLALHAMTYGGDLYILEADGLQSFEQPGAAGAMPQVFYVTPAVARASVILRDKKLARLDVDLWQPEGKEASLNADPTRTFSAGRAQLHFLTHLDNTIDVALRIDQGKLGDGYHPALGNELALIDLRGKLLNTAPLAGLETGSESVFDATEHWREAGGTLAVDKLSLDWGNVKTDLTGAIGLDEQHRPDGALMGTFDAGALVSALSKGNLNLTGMGEAKFSLLFKDGDIRVGAGSALAGTGR